MCVGVVGADLLCAPHNNVGFIDWRRCKRIWCNGPSLLPEWQNCGSCSAERTHITAFVGCGPLWCAPRWCCFPAQFPSDFYSHFCHALLCLQQLHWRNTNAQRQRAQAAATFARHVALGRGFAALRNYKNVRKQRSDAEAAVVRLRDRNKKQRALRHWQGATLLEKQSRPMRVSLASTSSLNCVRTAQLLALCSRHVCWLRWCAGTVGPSA